MSEKIKEKYLVLKKLCVPKIHAVSIYENNEKNYNNNIATGKNTLNT